jgi:hypothetical protein
LHFKERLIDLNHRHEIGIEVAQNFLVNGTNRKTAAVALTRLPENAIDGVLGQAARPHVFVALIFGEVLNWVHPPHAPFQPMARTMSHADFRLGTAHPSEHDGVFFLKERFSDRAAHETRVAPHVRAA